MASQSVWSKNSKLLRGNGDTSPGPETFVSIPEVIDLQCPTNTTELIDVSNLDSPGAFKEWLPSFIDGGDCRATLNFVPGNATQKQLVADQLDQTLHNFKVEFRNNLNTLLATMSFAAYITGFAPTANIREQLKATLTLRVTGAVSIV